MSENIELEKCPCCGGKARFYKAAGFISVSAEVRCTVCGLRTMEFRSQSMEDAKRMAAISWNRRDWPPAQPER